jgi:hypothetical protein
VNEEMHTRAQEWIAKERVEGLSAAEQEWLAGHLRECTQCAEGARATEHALRSLRTLSIPVPRTLVSRTQFRVRLRAQELRAREPRWRMVWVASGISWAFGAVSAPYVWRALEWIGRNTGLPKIVWEMGFGLWWALPAAVAAAVVMFEKLRQSDGDWIGLEE